VADFDQPWPERDGRLGHRGCPGREAAISRIPVVFLATGDPLSLGLVTSLAHPGGNLTGVPAAASSKELAKTV
jgi:hypothetical protein